MSSIMSTKGKFSNSNSLDLEYWKLKNAELSKVNKNNWAKNMEAIVLYLKPLTWLCIMSRCCTSLMDVMITWALMKRWLQLLLAKGQTTRRIRTGLILTRNCASPQAPYAVRHHVKVMHTSHGYNAYINLDEDDCQSHHSWCKLRPPEE